MDGDGGNESLVLVWKGGGKGSDRPCSRKRISGRLTFVCKVTFGTVRVFGCVSAVLWEEERVRAELSVRETERFWVGEGRRELRRNMGGRILWRDHSMPGTRLALAYPKSCYMLRRLHLPPSQPISMLLCGSPHRNH
jgi:hypothetical protein